MSITILHLLLVFYLYLVFKSCFMLYECMLPNYYHLMVPIFLVLLSISARYFNSAIDLFLSTVLIFVRTYIKVWNATFKESCNHILIENAFDYSERNTIGKVPWVKTWKILIGQFVKTNLKILCFFDLKKDNHNFRSLWQKVQKSWASKFSVLSLWTWLLVRSWFIKVISISHKKNKADGFATKYRADTILIFFSLKKFIVPSICSF